MRSYIVRSPHNVYRCDDAQHIQQRGGHEAGSHWYVHMGGMSHSVPYYIVYYSILQYITVCQHITVNSSICVGMLQDHLIGERVIADYALFVLNQQHKFE